MENKNAGYIWHPVWHIIPGLKNTKQNLKNSKLKEKKIARFQFYRNVFKTMKNHFFFLQVYRRWYANRSFPIKDTNANMKIW